MPVGEITQLAIAEGVSTTAATPTPIGALSGNTLTDAKILVGNASNVAAEVTPSGDVTITNAGVTAIASGVIVNADISGSAAIDYSKLATLTSGNIVLGNGSNVATSTAVTGDVTISSSGVTAIGTGVIVNADINASAAISGSKIQAASASNVGTVSKERIRSTWTPTLGGSGSDPTGVSYSVQQGYYAEVGQLVFFEIRIEFTTYSGGSGNLQIKGFPVNIISGTSTTSFHTLTSAIDLSSGYTYVGAEYASTTSVTLVQGGDNQTLSSLALTTAAPSSGTTKIIRITGVYMNQ